MFPMPGSAMPPTCRRQAPSHPAGFRRVTPLASATAIVAKVTVDAKALSEYAGLYEISPARGVADTRVNVTVFPIAFQIVNDAGTLRFSYAGSAGAMPFLPEDQTHFVADYDEDVRVEFVRGYDGRVESLIYREGENALEATKQH